MIQHSVNIIIITVGQFHEHNHIALTDIPF